jgi:hypothetical protein
MEAAQVDRLAGELAVRAEPIGFREVGCGPEDSGPEPPRGTRVWASRYAILALCPVWDPAVGALDETTRLAMLWLAERLDIEEERGRLLDAYLVLALPEPPTGPLLAAARETELDPSTCRKHTIWPDADGSWAARLDHVTVLDLPPARGLPGPGEPFVLPDRARSALEMAAGTDARRVIERIAADIDASEEEPDALP